MRRAHAVAALAVAASVGAAAYGVASLPPERGYDGAAHVRYAEVLRATGRLPTRSETYEYATPPAYPWLAVQAQRAADAVGVLPGWRAGQLVSVLWLVVELLLAWALARELAPAQPAVAAAVVVATAAIPIVLRLGVMFHPESQFAALALLALVLFVRASRRGWPLSPAAGVGVALGLAALTRQTAVAVIVALSLVAVAARAFRFAAVAAVAVVLVAGAWWGYQGSRFGNPLQANLDRPGYALPGGVSMSFFASAPVRSLVVHPYRPRFANRLFPQFYADLWSDWFGGQHHGWQRQSRAARAFASTQSVLAFPLTLFAIGALFALWLRRRDVASAACLVLTLVTWIAFVVEVVRFPQRGGDPIKSSYMLYLAPVFAAAAVVVGSDLWSRSRGWRVAIAACGTLYLMSYVGFVATSWG